MMKLFKKDESVDKYFYIIGWAGIAFVTAFIIAVKILGAGILDLVPPCTFKYATGYYCPGCGGTRAAFAFARGHFLRSVKYHPIVMYTAIVGGWFMISQTIEKVTRGKVRIAMHYRPIYVVLTLAIIFINVIYKDVMLYMGIALLG